MSEEKNEKTQEKLTIEKFSNQCADVLVSLSDVLIKLRDGVSKLNAAANFKHSELALTNALEHLAIDINDLRKLAEENKEAKK